MPVAEWTSSGLHASAPFLTLFISGSQGASVGTALNSRHRRIGSELVIHSSEFQFQISLVNGPYNSANRISVARAYAAMSSVGSMNRTKAFFSYRPGCAICDVTACGLDCTSVGDHSAASNSHGCLPNPHAFAF